MRAGDRIEMVGMFHDPDPILPGEKGTVLRVRPEGQETVLSVKWDSGRSLNVLLPFDKVKSLSTGVPA
jgi:transcription antitermination factor NusG